MNQIIVKWMAMIMMGNYSVNHQDINMNHSNMNQSTYCYSNFAFEMQDFNQFIFKCEFAVILI